MSGWLRAQDVMPLRLGADVLASGGVGDSYIAVRWAKDVLASSGPVRLVTWQELPGDGLVVPVAIMGSPAVSEEMLYHQAPLEAVVRAMEDLKRSPAVALIPIEAAGSNLLIALAAAASMGLPLVDGDGMGRAFPYLQITSWSLHALFASPLTVADDLGNQAICLTVNDGWAERMGRALTISMGGSIYIAAYAGTRSQLQAASIDGTVSRALALGESLMALKELRISSYRHISEQTAWMSGKVVEVLREQEPFYATILTHQGTSLLVEFNDQFESVLEQGKIVAQLPDIITLIDQSTMEPISCGQMRYGLRVHLITLEAPAAWYTSRGKQLWQSALDKEAH